MFEGYKELLSKTVTFPTPDFAFKKRFLFQIQLPGENEPGTILDLYLQFDDKVVLLII